MAGQFVGLGAVRQVEGVQLSRVQPRPRQKLAHVFALCGSFERGAASRPCHSSEFMQKKGARPRLLVRGARRVGTSWRGTPWRGNPSKRLAYTLQPLFRGQGRETLSSVAAEARGLQRQQSKV